MALCSLLAFWTGRDASRIDRALEIVSDSYDPQADDSTEANQTRSKGRDAPAPERAYLVERNRLVAERITQLEAELMAKDEQIEELKARLQ